MPLHLMIALGLALMGPTLSRAATLDDEIPAYQRAGLREPPPPSPPISLEDTMREFRKTLPRAEFAVIVEKVNRQLAAQGVAESGWFTVDEPPLDVSRVPAVVVFRGSARHRTPGTQMP